MGGDSIHSLPYYNHVYLHTTVPPKHSLTNYLAIHDISHLHPCVASCGVFTNPDSQLTLFSWRCTCFVHTFCLLCTLHTLCRSYHCPNTEVQLFSPSCQAFKFSSTAINSSFILCKHCSLFKHQLECVPYTYRSFFILQKN